MPNTTIPEPEDAKKWFTSDTKFNHLYPASIQMMARRHWTPLHTAYKAANFLAAENGVKILDIGSGVGKFCLAAACYKPLSFFYGVEQRKQLVNYANEAAEILSLENVSFIHSNFTQLDIKPYDHFYFFNAFYENLVDTARIDESIDYSGELYNYYNRYLFKLLDQKPAGTRLATFHSLEDEIPRSYHVVDTDADNLLKCWIKV
ncbi:methyltransferase domain-containing protein [Panacibacter ginsenosidivorans]|uniref:Methyltransferase domain-containing protein n=1 Tax=Panacibacter ginsenosidivorans TaxID=1813871 RepID=A0A5B8V9C2_9BACT|nr:methyltransferase domain-containing protein [Panacibacter ginsenosidivorans]QEC67451.1 methyltransferase domain-containing protein [Panacibacter ginsenosidivorans]